MIKKCLVCGKELHRSQQHGKRSSPKKRVGENQVTCGGGCGKTYDKISRHIRAKINQKTDTQIKSSKARGKNEM